MASVRGDRGRHGGQAVVEFVLVLNILLLLIVGVWQMGVAFSNYIDVSDAARAAARKASSYGAGTTFKQGDQDAAFAQATEAALSSAGCNIPCPSPPIGMTVNLVAGSGLNGYIAGNDITATVQAPFSISILGVTLYSGQLTSSTTMRIEKRGT
jgi:Flp pilus assembly protein TadG